MVVATMAGSSGTQGGAMAAVSAYKNSVEKSFVDKFSVVICNNTPGARASLVVVVFQI